MNEKGDTMPTFVARCSAFPGRDFGQAESATEAQGLVDNLNVIAWLCSGEHYVEAIFEPEMDDERLAAAFRRGGARVPDPDEEDERARDRAADRAFDLAREDRAAGRE
jgi:hypothetical protein